ncbi:MAG: YlxR family protein [Clostridia bacterium]|nr:YlxR family protein [Clostridia bacterium]
MNTKKVPMRMCMICRQMFDKRELVRLVKTDEGVFVDTTGKRNGRGSYVCSNPECVKKCAKHKVFRQFVGEGDFERVLGELERATQK